MAQKKDNLFYNSFFNIILPVLILKQKLPFLNFKPLPTLLIALSLPLLYSLWDYLKYKYINALSILGFIGILLTGGGAVLQLSGRFFAFKEGGIPLLIACFLLASIFFKKPFMKWLLFEAQLFDKDLVLNRIQKNKKEKEFLKLMNLSTGYLSGSFVLSAFLNFFIALEVFKEQGLSLSVDEKRLLLNEQIADITWLGYVFIALPLSFVLGGILWFLIKELKKLTQLSFKEMVAHKSS